MKPSQQNDIMGFVVGAIVTGALWWFLPFFHWGVYVVIWMVVSGWAIISGAVLGAATRKMDGE
ncbi:Uncharacterised protein [Starkeya nomas]|uniref:Uncharacterized protein n=1 Tax=Starkeya nomas TaxID=2666134 RepID=A0A5S9R3P7_9HYPH|nr:hypothetical protein [Starkeya nomas]CAA0129025.1 Uncharacterised protein [Starkeya nomas]